MRRAHVLSFVLSAALLAACTGAVGDAELGAGNPIDHDAVTGGDGGGSDSRSNNDGGGATDTSTSGGDTTPPPVDTSPPPEDTSPPPVDTAPPPPVDTGDPIGAARTTCLDEINKYRATLSLPPYVGWTSAETCVDGEAKKDSETGTAHSAFGSCGESAQNECPGWPGPPQTLIVDCLKMMWAEGPGDFAAHGHYINMSSTSYTSVSCGFYQTPSGDWWAAQDFR